MNNPPNSATCIRLVHGLTVEENGWSGFGQSEFIKWKLHEISLNNRTSTKRENSPKMKHLVNQLGKKSSNVHFSL